MAAATSALSSSSANEAMACAVDGWIPSGIGVGRVRDALSPFSVGLRAAGGAVSACRTRVGFSRFPRGGISRRRSYVPNPAQPKSQATLRFDQHASPVLFSAATRVDVAAMVAATLFIRIASMSPQLYPPSQGRDELGTMRSGEIDRNLIKHP